MVSQDVGKKILFTSLIALFQFLAVLVKVRHETTAHWAVVFIFTWIFLGVWLIYLLIHATCSRRTKPSLSMPSDLSSQQYRFMSIIRLLWTWILWATSLLFFILLASYLNDKEQGDVVDSTDLIYPWIAYFAISLTIAIIYAIISVCWPSTHHKHAPVSMMMTSSSTTMEESRSSSTNGGGGVGLQQQQL